MEYWRLICILFHKIPMIIINLLMIATLNSTSPATYVLLSDISDNIYQYTYYVCTIYLKTDSTI